MQMMNWFRACRDDYTRIHHLYVGEKMDRLKFVLTKHIVKEHRKIEVEHKWNREKKRDACKSEHHPDCFVDKRACF